MSFEYKGKKYTLEYSRKSVLDMEDSGFSISSDLGEKPLSSLLTLFHGAFAMHHPNLSSKTIDEIFEHLGSKDGLMEALVDMYSDPIEQLMGDPAEGKVEWVKSF